MSTVYDRHGVTVHHGDALTVLAGLPAGSIHAVVCDPPYSLGFMGRAWDTHDTPPAFQEWCRQWAVECLRVLTPGGHLLAFGGTRTGHRLTAGIEDAGFEIRDTITWLYGSGFPKSLDVSKAIDKARDDRDAILAVSTWLAEHAAARGVTRADVDTHMGTSDMAGWWLSTLRQRCQVPTWEQWATLRELIGFGPEMDAEVWRLNGRKGTPGEAWDQRAKVGEGYWVRRESDVQLAGISGGAYDLTAPATDAAREWDGWGTALKPASEPIVVARKPLSGTVAATVTEHGTGALNIGGCRVAGAKPDTTRGASVKESSMAGPLGGQGRIVDDGAGRWPTNVVLDEAAAAQLDAQSGTTASSASGSAGGRRHGGATYAQDAYTLGMERSERPAYGDEGGASRFFPVFRYEAKAPTAERPKIRGVAHPTVKPLSLMRWLVRLVTPPGGIVCDPFAGTGTTGHAARAEGFRAVLIEKDDEHIPLIVSRLDGYRDATTAPVDAVTGLAEPMDLLDLLAEDEAS